MNMNPSISSNQSEFLLEQRRELTGIDQNEEIVGVATSQMGDGDGDGDWDGDIKTDHGDEDGDDSNDGDGDGEESIKENLTVKERQHTWI